MGVRDFESEHLLQLLYQLPQIPEFQLRVSWEPDMIVMWDNRSTQHYAPRDYLPARRRMERLTIKGDRPFGVTGGRKGAAAVTQIAALSKGEDRTGRHRPGLARPAETMTAKSK